MKHTKILIVGLVILSITGCAKRHLYSDKQFLLGTVVEVISPYQEAANIAFKEIKRVENIFSIFIEDSALSHLNKTGFLNNNFEVAFLIEKSKKFYKLTGKKFDITVGPLVRIWKEAIGDNNVPDEAEIRRALKLVGFDKIHIDKKRGNIKFRDRGMGVDLGGIAKGYAVDCAVKELKRKGIDSAIINAGGDIYCLGSKFDRPWQLGLQHPRKKNKLFETLKLRDLAVVTSGDYQQYLESETKRYSHIIDPKTGYPVEGDVISVTVVAKDTLTADAVATCVFLLGKEKGIEVFKDYSGVERIIVITRDDVQ